MAHYLMELMGIICLPKAAFPCGGCSRGDGEIAHILHPAEGFLSLHWGLAVLWESSPCLSLLPRGFTTILEPSFTSLQTKQLISKHRYVQRFKT